MRIVYFEVAALKGAHVLLSYCRGSLACSTEIVMIFCT